jgi:Flp pilus assembly protein TadG
MFMVTRNLRRWRDRGAAAVEFALCVPMLVLLIFGSIEFGLYVQARTMVQNAAREGVRLASLNKSPADIEYAVDMALQGVSGTSPVVTSGCTSTAGACVIGSKTNPTGSVATVTVTLNYTSVTGLFVTTQFPKISTLTGSSYMRMETSA